MGLWYEKTTTSTGATVDHSGDSRGYKFPIESQIHIGKYASKKERGRLEKGARALHSVLMLRRNNWFLETPAYKSLIANIERECRIVPSTPNLMEDIRRKISNSLSSFCGTDPSPVSQSFRLTYKCKWDPLAFLKEQGYKEQPGSAIETAITLTGSDASAQAQTCIQYLGQTWPSIGLQVLQLIKDVVQSGPGVQHICRFTNSKLQ